LEQLVTIELFGQSYTFKAEEDVSKAEDVANLLVKEVEKVELQLSAKAPTINKQTILILAALNIASENYKLKNLTQEISERLEKLIRLLGMC
jgi:cell division protein ZapA (FtsZ GTPase activity inhibitor)